MTETVLDLAKLRPLVEERGLIKSHGFRVVPGNCRCCEQDDSTFEVWSDSCPYAHGIDSEEVADFFAAAPLLLAKLVEALGVVQLVPCDCRVDAAGARSDCDRCILLSSVKGWRDE